MTAAVPPIAALPAFAPSGGVRVELVGRGGKHVPLGDAQRALRDRRLTGAERAAIRALLQAVALLRARAGYAGIDDAGAGVRLVLRDRDASTGGPWATVGTIAVGARNALAGRAGGRARGDVLLTVDTALHELTHVVQFARIPTGVRPHAAILEGVADAAAILATGDDTLGEGYYRRLPDGTPRGAIREIGTAVRVAGDTLGDVVRRYVDALAPGVEEHAAGGVVSTTFVAIRTGLDRERAEQLLWHVVRDTRAWSAGGSWAELARAITRGTAALWPGDVIARLAVEAALAETGLDAATH